MSRQPFESIFTIHQDGTLEPKRHIRIGGVTIGPGIKFKDTFFGGVNLNDPQFLRHDLEISFDNNIPVITGIY